MTRDLNIEDDLGSDYSIILRYFGYSVLLMQSPALEQRLWHQNNTCDSRTSLYPVIPAFVILQQTVTVTKIGSLVCVAWFSQLVKWSNNGECQVFIWLWAAKPKYLFTTRLSSSTTYFHFYWGSGFERSNGMTEVHSSESLFNWSLKFNMTDCVFICSWWKILLKCHFLMTLAWLQ